MDTKTCKSCKETTPVSNFTGKYAICKKCRAEHKRNIYHLNKQQKETLNMYRKEFKLIADITDKLNEYKSVLIKDDQKEEKTIELETLFNELINPEKPKEFPLPPTDVPKQPSKSEKNEYLYLLTSATHEKSNQYKVGIHTGSLNKLKSRYKTYLIDVNVLRFVKCDNFRDHERNVHTSLSKFRLNNTEWFEIPKDQILNVFDNYTNLNITQIERYHPKFDLSTKETDVLNKLTNMVKMIDSKEYSITNLDAEAGHLIDLIEEMSKKYPDKLSHFQTAYSPAELSFMPVV